MSNISKLKISTISLIIICEGLIIKNHLNPNNPIIKPLVNSLALRLSAKVDIWLAYKLGHIISLYLMKSS